ncbi:MAG: DUF1501 domain-containing protein [Herpetosiphon sp.]
MTVGRREFLVGCSAAVAAMAGGRLSNLVFGDSAQAATPANAANEILVVIFLRGGCDGLSLISPYDDPLYAAARGKLSILDRGPQAAIPLRTQNRSVTSSMGFHPAAAALNELYTGGQLALVNACGIDDATRSHFDAMDYMERGTPGVKTTTSGWITRHVQSSGLHGAVSALAAGDTMPASLLGNPDAVAIPSLPDFRVDTHWRYAGKAPLPVMDALTQIHNGAGAVQTVARRTLDTVRTLQAQQLKYTTPVAYPDTSFSTSLREVAQMVKLDLGLRIATVDLGSWDTHEHQGDQGTGYFAAMVDTLSRGLHAFYEDLQSYHSRLTVVAMSEFGRRLKPNSSGGTDHGHGGVMMVLGGNVNGGKLYGQWPGLQDLDQGEDLRITTDFRTVLSEILVRRMGNTQLDTVFPGFNGYQPLGILQGGSIIPAATTPPRQIQLPMITR